MQELSERLDRRFALLTDGSRSAAPRHRTLRSTIDWSYDLLGEVEQAMLRRVAVFAGGWTLAAAQQVCTADAGDGSDPIAGTLGLLTSLADKNLILAEEHDGATRYRMLETIRQYALDRLRESGEEARWRQRHFAWVLTLAEASFEPLRGPQQGAWVERTARELDNFRAALGWAIEQKSPDGLRLAPQLSRWWSTRAQITEARDWLSRLLEVVPRDQAPLERARALGAVGNLALLQRDHEAAGRLFRESLALLRGLDDPRRVASVLTNLALLALARGHYAQAEPLLVECAALARGVGDLHLVAVNVGNLAIAVHARGDRDRAAALYAQSLALARDSGDAFLVSEVLSGRGRAECRNGDLESAESSLAEGLAIAADLTDPHAAAEAFEGCAELAVARHAAKRAATLFGAAARLREAMALPLPVHEEGDHDRLTAAARAALGEAAFDQAWRDGSAMALDQAMAYALNAIRKY